MESTPVSPIRPDDTPVLVVEDDPKLGSLLVRALATYDVEGELAVSGERALAMAAGRSYAAVVIDQMLPGMDGLQLCRRLRRGGLGAPVIIMSARDDLGGEIDPAGADGYLLKPFPLNLLLSTLGALPRRSPRASRNWGDLTLS